MGDSQMFCVIDLETTGLDKSEDKILEIGAILLNENLDSEAVPAFHRVIYWNDFIGELHPDVVEMHSNNGLLDECRESETSSFQALAEFEDWCFEKFSGFDVVYATGNNIKFDLGFLEQNSFPLDTYFHYRSVDISSVKVLTSFWAPEVNHFPNTPIPKKLHRSIPDCYDSILELAWYKDMLWTPPDD